MYKYLKLLNINQIYQFSLNCLIYKIINEFAPSAIIEGIVLNQIQDKIRSTRQKHFLSKPQYTLDLATRCYSWQGPHLWNLVPYEIKYINNYKHFKRQLFDYILNI